MSNNLINEVWKHAGVKGNDLLVLLVLADMAGDDGRMAWPSVERVARMTNMSRASVYRALGALNEAHVVVDVPVDEWPAKAKHYNAVVREILPVEEWASSNSSQIETPPENVPGTDDKCLNLRRGGSQFETQSLTLTPSTSKTPDTTYLSLTGAAPGPRPKRRSRQTAGFPDPTPAKKPTAREKARAALAAEDESDPFKVILAEESPAPSPAVASASTPSRARSVGPAQRLAMDFGSYAKSSPGSTPGSTNQGALAGSFAAWLREGFTRDQILALVRMYWSGAWEGQRAAHRPSWQDFLARRGALAAAVNRAQAQTDLAEDALDESAWTFAAPDDSKPESGNWTKW